MHKINTVYTQPFILSDGAPVSGAVLTDFSRKLLDGSGTDQAALISVTEIVETPSAGRYYAAWTPASAGQWKFWLSYTSGSPVPLYDSTTAVEVYDAPTLYEDSTHVNTPYTMTMRLTTLAGQAISGAVTTDFGTLVLDPYGTDKSALFTTTEILDTPRQGRYYGSFTPDSEGLWKLWITYSAGGTTYLDYNAAITVTIGDELAGESGDALTAMVTRCKTQYAHLETGMSQFVAYRKWTDGEWVSFIEDALDAFNSAPPNFTNYTLDRLPDFYRSLVKDRAIINALLAHEIHEAQKHFQYNDNGISFVRDQHGKFSATRTSLITQWMQMVQLVKKIAGLSGLRIAGQFSGTCGVPRSLDRAMRGVRKWNR
jgi:hypothetical protein